MNRSVGFRSTFLLFALCAIFAASVTVLANDPTTAIPGVTDLTSANFDTFVGKDAAAFVEFYAPWCGHCKNLVPEMKRLGEAVQSNSVAKGKLIIGKVDATVHKDLGSKFGVQGYPTIFFFPAGSQKPMKYEQSREATAMSSFLSGQIAGLNLNLPREHHYVLELDATNFDDFAMDPSKDALVMFYAPWCGHCKRLHPIFDRLARVFRNDKDVIIASVNADEGINSDLRTKYDVKGFPTLVFLPKNAKEDPVKYEKERELEQFVAFLNEKSGKHRLLSGDLSFTVGVHASLTRILKDILADGKSAEEKKAAVAQIETEAAAIGDEGAKLYPRIAARLQKEGAVYVEKELARIERVKAGDVEGAKRDVMCMRSNILNSIKSN